MPKGAYVDNAYNRRMGRVGMEYGTAVISRSGSSSAGSQRSSGTYVDNAFNRSVGRVGMEYGTAVISRSGSSSAGSQSSTGSYVDNAYNRSVGRVGMEYGTAVISRPGSSSAGSQRSSGTYVDNVFNRILGRVGMEKGTAVISKSGSSKGRSQRSSGTYVDNAFNRILGRVGMEKGTAVISRSDSSVTVKVYKDNDFNRRHNRVGLPIGSKPISRKAKSRTDTPRNPRRGDEIKEKIERAKQRLIDMVPDDYNTLADELQEYLEYARFVTNRVKAVDQWQEECQTYQQPRTNTKDYEKQSGGLISFEELRLRRKIGQGSFGVVYFAIWKKQPVAVKKLHVQKVSDRRLKEFIREVELLIKLKHKNIVRFLGGSVDPPNLCIVMELMDLSLFDALHCEKDIVFDDTEKLAIITQVCAGLAYMHEIGVAHCDMKSKNILLNMPETEQDEEQPYRNITAKLTDFGLSMMKAETETSMSGSYRNRGTPRYSAPEVLRGERLNREQYIKADVYSFGLVMLEVFTEEEPFYDLNEFQLRKQVGEKGMIPNIPEDIRIDEDIYPVMNQCWDHDPNLRPTADEVLNKFHKLKKVVCISPEEAAMTALLLFPLFLS